MKYALFAAAALLGAAVAIVLWAAYDFNPFADWEDMYQ